MDKKRIILTPPFTPSLEQYKRGIRFDDVDDAQEEALHIYNLAKEQLQPKVVLYETFIDDHFVEDNLSCVTIEGIVFKGKALRVLDEVNRVFIYIATSGAELENFDYSSSDMLAPYWVDTIKKQALRDARIALINYVKNTYGISKPKSLNPGSGNVDIWPIEEQIGLFKLIGGGEEIGVSLNESCLMNPNKSISGFMFASIETDYESCAYCERERCPNRRVPFKEVMK